MDSLKLDEYIEKILSAVETIQEGACKRVDIDNKVKVYECKNVIRIDIKTNG